MHLVHRRPQRPVKLGRQRVEDLRGGMWHQCSRPRWRDSRGAARQHQEHGGHDSPPEILVLQCAAMTAANELQQARLLDVEVWALASSRGFRPPGGSMLLGRSPSNGVEKDVKNHGRKKAT